MTSVPAFDRWFVRPAGPRPQARIRCVVLPFAGGGPAAFRDWYNRLGPEIDLLVLQLPGRERRIAEPPVIDLAAAVAAIATAVAPAFDLPVVFFGHSMGAILAFEVVRLMRRHGRPIPAHLFVSGFRAPDSPDPRPQVAQLDDPAFFAELRRLGGTPPAVLDNEELMGLVLPALRADFRLVESYRFIPEEPLSCPVTAFAGTQDREAAPEAMAGWTRQTSRRFLLHSILGSHFFVLEQSDAVVATVRAQIESLLRGGISARRGPIISNDIGTEVS